MKILITFILSLFCATAVMAQPFTTFPTINSNTGTDQFYCVQTLGIDNKCTLSNMAKYVLSIPLTSQTINAGNISTFTQVINESMSISGFSANTYLANLFNNTADTANVSGLNFVTGWDFVWSFGGNTVQGGRQTLQSIILQTAASNAANVNRNYVAGTFLAQTASGDGGTNLTSDSRGNYFALNPYYNLISGAVNIGLATGGEVNSIAQTGSSLKFKSLWNLVGGGTLDQVQGSSWDTMLAFSNQTGGVGHNSAILIGDMHGAFPIASDGSLIQAISSSSVTYGLDFHTLTFTGCSLELGTIINACGNGLTLGGAPSNSGAFLTMLSNTTSVYPPSATTSWSIADHFNGFHEMDLWNDDTAATQAFAFLQKTGTSTATTVFAISSSGQLTAPGTTTGTPVAALCLDSSNNIIKKVGTSC